MTILDYDKRQKCCPVCKAERLVFITDAPASRPIGKTLQYRCKGCATKEAAAAGDPLTIVRHCERRYVPPAWEKDQRPDPPHLKAAREQLARTRDKALSQATRRV